MKDGSEDHLVLESITSAVMLGAWYLFAYGNGLVLAGVLVLRAIIYRVQNKAHSPGLTIVGLLGSLIIGGMILIVIGVFLGKGPVV